MLLKNPIVHDTVAAFDKPNKIKLFAFDTRFLKRDCQTELYLIIRDTSVLIKKHLPCFRQMLRKCCESIKFFVCNEELYQKRNLGTL